MRQHIGYISLLVREYDEAIFYFVEQIGFDLVEDSDLGNGKRWVLIAPAGSQETRILLAKAVTPDQTERVGDQAGGRVFLFLQTDDFWRDYEAYRSKGVHFREEPRVEPYGAVAVFDDLYGNRWDERNAMAEPRGLASERCGSRAPQGYSPQRASCLSLRRYRHQA